MKTKEKKILNHPFLDKHTILGACALGTMAILIAQVLVGGLVSIVATVVAMITGVTDFVTVATLATQAGAALGGFVVLAVFWRWFYPEYEGSLKGGTNVLYWIGIAVAIVVAIFAFTLATEFDSLGVPPATSLITALMAGVSEEAVFRGVIGAYLLRQWRGERKLLPAAFLSAALFGLYHMSNLAVGAPLAMTVIQVVNSFALGFLLCALFYRSGNILTVMIFHFLYDMVAFTDVSALTENGTYKSDVVATLTDYLGTGVLAVVFIAIGLVILRSSVREDVAKMWNRKWKVIEKTEAEESEEAPEKIG